jgi:1-acyl-sn-glycerol-3-phosphate acyltransferase
MIPARKNPVFEALFARHARARIARSFAALRVRGASAARTHGAGAPLLVVSNHTAWWDPLVALSLSRDALDADGHAMMDAKNLRRLPFFGLVGAFGVDLDDPADGARALRYARRLLDRPGRLVWIFAQGRELPVTERPLGFRAGSAELGRIARQARVIPVALRYEMGGDERPVAWASIGAPIETAGRAAHETAVEAELDRIDAALRSGNTHAFPALIEGRTPWLGALAERALARITR